MRSKVNPWDEDAGREATDTQVTDEVSDASLVADPTVIDTGIASFAWRDQVRAEVNRQRDSLLRGKARGDDSTTMRETERISRITHPPRALPTAFEQTVIDQRYRIVAKLGAGASGEVYEAEQLSVGRRVAIKRLHAGSAGDNEMLARFLREAHIGGVLDHPNIVGVLDLGRLPDGSVYIVMRLARGESLASLMKRQPEGLPWRQACGIVAQIAEALAHAHAVGIVHRDLKPDHIMLEPKSDGSYHVQVLDFGLARLTAMENAEEDDTSAATTDLTRSGALLGTIGYMAPEQLMNAKVDPRADLYTLGILLWEIIAGRWLFRRGTRIQTLTAQTSAVQVRLPDNANSQGAPQSVHDLVTQLLQRLPQERPADAATVRDVLQRCSNLAATAPLTSPRRYRTALLWLVPASALIFVSWLLTCLN